MNAVAAGTLRVVPIGGLGEIGRNMLALETEQDIVVIDCGLMFPEQDMLGIDLVIPDVSYLVQHKEKVRGIFLTHGHEDHVGALPYVLPRVPVPVYGTPLTVGLLAHKLKEHGLAASTEVITVTPGRVVSVGSMSVEFIHTTHSIPDACALAVRTPLGIVLHTGDFKLDSTPIHGTPPDLGRIAALGNEGVLLLLSDSTNVDSPGVTPSERTVAEPLAEHFHRASGRIIMATFASNISRLQQALSVAESQGRRALLVGRSMLNNVRVAHDLGLLEYNEGTLVAPKKLSGIPDASMLVLCTGSQGEPLSALTRIASGQHPMVSLKEGDTVILSANPIPGNEEMVHRTINNLYRRGATVFHSSRHGVHASGHASREELKLLLTLVRPRYFIPVHGEYRHLKLHAQLGASMGVTRQDTTTVDNGVIVEIDASGFHVTGERASCGYVYVDGVSIPEDGEVVLRDRQHIAHDGIVIVACTVERSTGMVVSGPELVMRGVAGDGLEGLTDEAREKVLSALAGLSPDVDQTVWQAVVHRTLARFFSGHAAGHPMVLPVITMI